MDIQRGKEGEKGRRNIENTLGKKVKEDWINSELIIHFYCHPFLGSYRLMQLPSVTSLSVLPR
jgi:hypothetical protein